MRPRLVAVEAKRGSALATDSHRWQGFVLLPVPPYPLESGLKCIGCSLHGVWLPHEHQALKAEAVAHELGPIRRIIPGWGDRAAVHVTRHGTFVRKEASPRTLSGSLTIPAPVACSASCPPRDRVNALLSFGYSLLTRDATAAAAPVGLDPMLGFLHVVHPGRPALALDLVEPFRAAWVDTAVLRLLATRGIDRDDFVVSSAGVVLTDRGRRSLISAYERRADELTTHPRFGYRMSYRRLLELEARVLGKWLVGEIEHYTPLWTR